MPWRDLCALVDRPNIIKLIDSECGAAEVSLNGDLFD